jgi:chromate transporter
LDLARHRPGQRFDLDDQEPSAVNTSLLGELAKTFALISIIAIGGATATVPEIHRQVVETLHWMDDATFANILAVSQIAPGPNVMIVGMIGWQVAGGAGLMVAMLAMLLPSCALAFAAGRTMQRFSTHHVVVSARRALAPIAVGLILASGLVVARAADRGTLTIAITAGMTLFIVLTRANPLFGILAGAALGVIGGRIGFFV